MIHYSSIKDAWGKKDMFKNNIPSGKLTNIYESATNCNVQPVVQPEKFTQQEDIKYDIPPPPQPVQPIIEPKVNVHFAHEHVANEYVTNEHFAQNSCAFMEHLQSCPFCMSKMKEHFADSTTDNNPISTINIFGFKINITQDVLKVLFIIILIVIFILLLRMVNVSFKKDNTSNADLLRLMTQMKYLNLV